MIELKAHGSIARGVESGCGGMMFAAHRCDELNPHGRAFTESGAAATRLRVDPLRCTEK
jgi:hypothetical protein